MSQDAPVQAIVVDIEGTTSATAAVHVGLYDYARPRLGPWITEHRDDPEVAGAVAATIADGGLPADAGVDEVVGVLHQWMDGDVKAVPLKTLQGQIWAAGFAAGDLTPHFFDDVAPALRAWHAAGITLAVFSSGSVASQKPWFGHAPGGDLAELMSGFFDPVAAAPKRERVAYERIAAALGVAPEVSLFLSDVPAELDAARAAGWRTTGLRRPGEPAEAWDFGDHPVVASFAEVRW